MFLLLLLLFFGFMVFLGNMGHLCRKFNVAPSTRLYFWFIGWYIALSAILFDICYNGSSFSLKSVFIGILAPMVLYELLRLIRRWLSWSFKGLDHFK